MNQEQDPHPLEPTVNETRRRLAKAGLAAPAVMGVLASRPVLGASDYRCTISGQISGNLSRPGDAIDYRCTISGQISGNLSRPGDAIDCGTLGRSPGYWKNHTGLWPGVSPHAYFNSIFADAYCYKQINDNTTELASCSNSEYSPNPTLLQVLQATGGMNGIPHPALGRAAVASYLNALAFSTSNPPYPLTPDRVVAMFNAVYNGGTYEVAPGVAWNASQVLAYFESLYNG